MEFRLTTEENAKFKSMVASSGCKNYSEFIRKRVFSHEFNVVISDENTLKFYNELRTIKSKIDIIGVSYNNYITTLRHHFTESRAADISRKNAKLLGEIVILSEKALQLTLQIVKRWLPK